MDAKLKADWVKALRSGEYEQGKGALLHDNKYCCLGVFCNVAGVKIDGPNVLNGHGDASSSYRELERLIGIPDSSVLTEMNDGTPPDMHWHVVPQHSFNKIADYIEANIPSDESVAS